MKSRPCRNAANNRRTKGGKRDTGVNSPDFLYVNVLLNVRIVNRKEIREVWTVVIAAKAHIYSILYRY